MSTRFLDGFSGKFYNSLDLVRSDIGDQPDIGQLYDKIAKWWDEYHLNSEYGVAQLRRALTFAKKGGTALDVGCGSGGRLLRLLESESFDVIGIDASKAMLELAKANHPDATFVHTDIRQWKSQQSFDFILAWDSLFHLPLNAQKPVLKKLCRLLSPGGVMIISLGDDIGEHTDKWKGQIFPYSSIGLIANIETLGGEGLFLCHAEIDQYPEKHAFIVSQKPA